MIRRIFLIFAVIGLISWGSICKGNYFNCISRRIRGGEAKFDDYRQRMARLAYYKSQMEAETIWEEVEREGSLRDLSLKEKEILKVKLQRIEAVVRSLGKDFNLKIAPGREWAYDFETNTVTLPYHEVLSNPEIILIASSIHEAGHRQISRVIDKTVFEKESKRALWNAIEDPRVNNWMMKEYMGVKQSFMKPLYEDIFPTDPRDRRWQNFEYQLPHMQFLLGVIYYWAHGEEHPLIKDPKVLEALAKTREDVQAIYNILPAGSNPNERQIREAAKRVHELIEEKIYPIYQELVEESVKKVEEMLASGEYSVGVGGVPMGGLSPEELSENARELVEKASKKLADVLESKVDRPDLQQARKYVRDIHQSQKGRREPSQRTGGEAQAGEEGEGIEELIGRIRDHMERQREFEQARERYATPYSRYLREVMSQIEELAGYLEPILEPDVRSKKQGYYWSGSQISIPRIIQSEGSDTLLPPFMKRVKPEQRSYVFSLVLDESGSMAEGIKDFNLKCATVLFMEVLERLKIDYEVAGFHTTHIVHKEFGEKLDFQDKDEKMLEIEGAIGGGATHDVEAVNRALERMREQTGDMKVIIVITDGEGNGPGDMSQAIERANQEGVYLIGVGVGEGTEYVKHQYDLYVQVEDVTKLPSAIAQLIEEIIILGY